MVQQQDILQSILAYNITTPVIITSLILTAYNVIPQHKRILLSHNFNSVGTILFFSIVFSLFFPVITAAIYKYADDMKINWLMEWSGTKNLKKNDFYSAHVPFWVFCFFVIGFVFYLMRNAIVKFFRKIYRNHLKGCCLFEKIAYFFKEDASELKHALAQALLKDDIIAVKKLIYKYKDNNDYLISIYLQSSKALYIESLKPEIILNTGENEQHLFFCELQNSIIRDKEIQQMIRFVNISIEIKANDEGFYASLSEKKDFENIFEYLAVCNGHKKCVQSFIRYVLRSYYRMLENDASTWEQVRGEHFDHDLKIHEDIAPKSILIRKYIIFFLMNIVTHKDSALAFQIFKTIQALIDKRGLRAGVAVIIYRDLGLALNSLLLDESREKHAIEFLNSYSHDLAEFFSALRYKHSNNIEGGFKLDFKVKSTLLESILGLKRKHRLF